MPRTTNRTRREFLFGSGALLGAAGGFIVPSLTTASPRVTGIIPGAIRWDAWYTRADVSLSAQNSLSTAKYYKRAPWFCSVTSDYQTQCIGSAAEMDAEIHAAAKAGLKYWAFDWYSEKSSLHTAWTLYRSSPARKLINWCGIVEFKDLGSTPFSNNEWQQRSEMWADLMRQPEYQKVTIAGVTRPLLYVLWDQSHLGDFFAGSLSNVRRSMDSLRSAVARAGLGTPYIVILDGAEGAPIVGQVGADAISGYIAAHRQGIQGSYRELDQQARVFWKRMADTRVQSVPIAMVGWDTRARQERPVPWQHVAPDPNPTKYYALPQPSELADHVRAAMQFIKDQPALCPSKALLIYSWDECDEGGGLIPTIGDPKGGYLAAIEPVLTAG